MLKKINTYLKMIEGKMFFNKTEKDVLRILAQNIKPTTIGDMWKSSHVNRLTLLYSLKKLEKRGFVRCDKTKKAHTWVFVQPNIDIFGNAEVDSNKYVSIDDAYDILRKSSQQKIVGIQGVGAVSFLVESMKINPDRFSRIHIRQKLRQTIIDSILTEKAAEKIQSLSKKALLTHFGRPTILHVIPESNFISDYEVISDGKLLIITNHKENKALVLRDPLIIKTTIAFLEIIKISGIKKNIAEIYGIE